MCVCVCVCVSVCALKSICIYSLIHGILKNY